MKEIFDKRLKERASKIRYFFSDVDGTLTNGTSYYSESGEVLKQFSFIDGTGFYLLTKLDITGGIITGENSPIVLRRAEKLDLNHCFLDVQDKFMYMQHFAREHCISLENIAYIGDDLNDMNLLKNVGLSFCPIDAHNLIKANVDIVCTKNGGYGAFREAVEILCNLLNKDILRTFLNSSI
jgi:YrbI family 3-deoxy-D-manno-octulosonate 8-phosphate phosphatase